LQKQRQDHQDRIGELEGVHRHDVERFEQDWQAGHPLLEFNKPSPRLIALRRSEHCLALGKLFERAREMKAMADRLERDEAQEARARAVAAMKVEYENIEAKHKREMTCLKENCKRHADVAQAERDRDLRPLNLLVERLVPIAQGKRHTSPLKVKDRSKEVIRPMRDVQSARAVIKPYGLGLQGITARKHIKMKKEKSAEQQKQKQKQKKKVGPAT
jgi:hypothetical protein